MPRPFAQIDVFTAEPLLGNPVAVVLGGTGLRDDEMQRFARWTNLSETTFVTPPTEPTADYRVRIFTPAEELPFAGHPTLGTCHAWLEAGGVPRAADAIVQECGVGPVTIRRIDGRLAFAAPPRSRTGVVDVDVVDATARACGLDPSGVLAAEWVVNGPEWMALLVDSPASVLGAVPRGLAGKVGLVAMYPPGSPEAIEVRAFFDKGAETAEDPATGSLNASLAQWLIESGRLEPPYVAAQGAALGRAARIHVSQDDAGQVWIGGDTITCVSGTADL
jgi:PhzF family phenazine biosynthesis protein